MRTSLPVSLFVALLSLSSSFSASPEDLEGSGNDLESSASGSWDWSEQDEDEDTWAGRTSENTEDDPKRSSYDPLVTFDKQQWPSRDSYVILANKKPFLENKEVRDGVIAGGVTGVILAATVASILIYKWQKEDTQCHRRQRVSSEEDYHRQYRDEVIVV